jgi:hypothetical protein
MAPPTQQADVKVGKAEPVRPSSPQPVGAYRNKTYQNSQPSGARERASKDACDYDYEPVSGQGGNIVFT